MRLLPLLLLVGLAACATHPGRVGLVVHASDAQAVEAVVDGGKVRGVEGMGVRTFLGLPYAAPPVGPLRWRAPQPVSAWSGVRDATRIGRDCTQALGRDAILGGGGGIVVGAEDCLYLNVYAPAGAGPHPVMVFLPGGAFTIGAGANYDPTRLVRGPRVKPGDDGGRVVVTVNYRLGALGWLAHPDFAEDGDGVGGNWGLMDQQAALRWVRANIGALGGDAANISVFGESAGAWSACHLMASPGSQGLFDRVILQSGTCIEPQSLRSADEAAADGPAFAASVACKSEAVVECLRALPARRIARAASTRAGLNGPGSWGPVYGDSTVPVAPPLAFVRGDFVRVPVVIGTNADEGRLFAVQVRDADRYAAQTRWMYGASGDAVLARYPIDPAEGKAGPALAMARSFTDQKFACPAEALRRLLARYVPVSGYEFADRDAPLALPSWLFPYDMGAYHASELTYVFGTRWAFADPGRFTPQQAALGDRMRALWAGFGHGDGGWPEGGRVLILDPAGNRVSDDFAARHQCDFWATTPFGPLAPAR